MLAAIETTYHTGFSGWGTIFALIIAYYFLLALMCAWYCQHIAVRKNRNAMAWTFAGFFYSLIAVVMIGFAHALPQKAIGSKDL